jgi:hypothetical protein
MQNLALDAAAINKATGNIAGGQKVDTTAAAARAAGSEALKLAKKAWNYLGNIGTPSDSFSTQYKQDYIQYQNAIQANTTNPGPNKLKVIHNFEAKYGKP